MASPAPASSTEDGSLFASYERQYATTSTSVATALRQLQASGSTAEKVRQLEGQLKDAEMTLQRMDMEARSATPQSASMALVKKVKDYKRDHQTLLMDVRAAGRGASSRGAGGGAGGDSVENRAELGLSGYKTEAQQQRDRMLTATDRLEQTGERIREGRKQLLETEAIGEDVLSELQRQREAIERSRGAAADVRARTAEAESLELGVAVLSDLQRQRESIMHSRETLGAVDANVGVARQVLATMSRRITQNKLIMYGVIAVLSGAILLLIYAKVNS